MSRRSPALPLAALTLLLTCGTSHADGRETEIMRTFIASFRDYLARTILPAFPADQAGQDQAYAARDSTGVLVHAKRGPLKAARWQLSGAVQDTLRADLETLHPHASLTPELELFEVRLREVLEVTKGDSFKPTRKHFDTVHGRLRVRFHSLSHLADMAALSVGLELAFTGGTGDGQEAPGFDGLNR